MTLTLLGVGPPVSRGNLKLELVNGDRKGRNFVGDLSSQKESKKINLLNGAPRVAIQPLQMIKNQSKR